MIDLRIRLDDREVQQYLAEHGPRQVRNALRSAVRTTSTWAHREMDRRMAAATALPVSIFKKHRIKHRIQGGGVDSVESGHVWVGYKPIRARYAGPLRQDETGAWAGPYYFKGGFIARMPTGMVSLFKRRPKAALMPADAKDSKGRPKRNRLPIEEQTVKLSHAAERIGGEVADLARAELLRRFRAKFQER